MYVILLGPPYAGKGTQADILAERTGLVHVASGDLFRAALKQGTPLGLEAKGYMDRGELVPDAVTIAMIFERVREPDCEKGVILDGFPRTIQQAISLDASLAERELKADRVLYITVPNEVLLQRVTGRRICKNCGLNYNVNTKPPAVEGVCDSCGGELYQRADDTAEVAQKRLDVYFEQTEPLVDHYRQKDNVLREIDGNQPIETVTSLLVGALE